MLFRLIFTDHVSLIFTDHVNFNHLKHQGSVKCIMHTKSCEITVYNIKFHHMIRLNFMFNSFVL